MPEQPTVQRDLELRVFPCGLFQGLIQAVGVHILVQGAADAEHPRVLPVDGRQKYFGDIIDFIPGFGQMAALLSGGVPPLQNFLHKAANAFHGLCGMGIGICWNTCQHSGYTSSTAYTSCSVMALARLIESDFNISFVPTWIKVGGSPLNPQTAAEGWGPPIPGCCLLRGKRCGRNQYSRGSAWGPARHISDRMPLHRHIGPGAHQHQGTRLAAALGLTARANSSARLPPAESPATITSRAPMPIYIR